jgi:hypothetical protein
VKSFEPIRDDLDIALLHSFQNQITSMRIKSTFQGNHRSYHKFIDGQLKKSRFNTFHSLLLNYYSVLIDKILFYGLLWYINLKSDLIQVSPILEILQFLKQLLE